MSEPPIVRFRPADRHRSVPSGTTLLDAAQDAGVGIEHLCGGNGLCGTCEVAVEEGGGDLCEPTEVERRVLDDDAIATGRRLACRCELHGGEATVVVPPASRVSGSVILTEGTETDLPLAPAVKHHRLEVDEPALEDNLADRERLLRALDDTYGLEVSAVDPRALRELPARLRDCPTTSGLEVTATVFAEDEVIAVHGGYESQAYGLAIDVGTTTLATYLVNLVTGEVEAVDARLNPQRAHGEDLMSRMRHCRQAEGGRHELRSAVLSGLNDSIETVCTEAGVASTTIYEAVCVGNTAMHHLFLGIDPGPVAGAPYVPAAHASIQTKARDADLDIHPGGYVTWLPVSGGWVGPDAVAVLLASGQADAESMTVSIDIGTNGEIAVGNHDRLVTASAPAGPALEGAELSDGMRARPGAIEAVSIDAESLEPTVETIDDTAPAGICGSGVIDALAECLLVGIVDRRGTIREAVCDHPRVRRTEADVLEYVLAWADESAVDGDVTLTQQDIRDVQMAKAAIQAGTLVLLEEIEVETIDRVVVAGGFGNYIDPDAARIVGLYPDVPGDRVTSLGNAAGAGAQMALLNEDARADARRIVETVEYVEIAGTDRFESHFLESMYLPHQRLDTHPRIKNRLESVRTLDEVEEPIDG